MKARRATCLLALALSISLATPTLAGQSVKLKVALTPERLNAGTTIIFSLRVLSPAGQIPSPMTAVSLLYPANIGLVTSGLGLATCALPALELLGPEGCPHNALMGRGSALVEIPFGEGIIHETGEITIWMAPVQEGHLRLLFDAEGENPVSAQLIFPSVVLDAPQPYGGRLVTQLPVVPTWPGAPNAAVVQMRVTIGPKNVTYYEHVHGKVLAYRPNGIVLPNRCPNKGFPFAANFTFIDGTHASAQTSVPCPRHTRSR